MITIEHLQVEFEVDGDDEAVFKRLFERHIERWSRRQEQEERAEKHLRRDRAIGSRREGGGTP